MEKPDAIYARRPWTMPEEGFSSVPNQSQGPFALNNDRVDAERMIEEISALAVPRDSQLFRARFGWDTDPPDIYSVIHVDEEFPQPVDTFSRDTYGSYSGTQTPGFSNDLGKP